MSSQKQQPSDESQALTEKELNDVKAQTKPSMGKMFGVSIGLGVLGFGALAGGLSTIIDAPQRSDYEITDTAATEITNSFSTEIHNPHGVLSAEDEARMERDVERLDVPAVVQQLHYIVFEEK